MRRGILALAAAFALSGAAYGNEWMDDFEGYAAGTLLSGGLGGWYGWDANPAAAGVVSNAFAWDGENSIEISGTDAVQPELGITSGQWTITAYQYIATADFSADTYFIVNNDYSHGGPYTWAIEMQFDIATGTVLDDFRDESNVINIIFDEWVEIRIDVDLDADTQTTWYGGVELSAGTWTRNPGDPLEISNIDLFSTGGTAYYDGMSVVPAPGVLALLGLAGLAGTRRRRR
jgi:MYXO-CTERM domain-containing protein